MEQNKNRHINYSSSPVMADLNEEQRKAVECTDTHALVLAGAGTGKTRVIVHHAWHLISNMHIDPRKILLITFTRRAAHEMLTRLTDNRLGEAALYIFAGTFHQFCLYNLRRYPDFFRCEGYSIIDRDDQTDLMKIVREEYLRRLPNIHTSTTKKKQAAVVLPVTQDLLSTYSYIRNTDMDYKDYLRQYSLYNEEIIEHILTVYEIYESKKQENRYLDFDDLLVKFADALSDNKSFCSAVCGGFEHVLVDEMQDTNPIQWRILDILKDYAKLFCVGDDAQSIYAFRGADFKNIHSFPERVPNSKVFRLSKNYRSTQQILDFANWLLNQSPLQYNKRLVSADKKQGRKPLFKTMYENTDEAEWVVKDIKKRHTHGANWSDMMVIVRTGYMVRPLEHILLNSKIPYVFIGGMSILQTAHIKDMLSLIRAAGSLKDSIAWMRYVSLFRGIGNVIAGKIVSLLSQSDNFEQALDNLQENFRRKHADNINLIITGVRKVKRVWDSPTKAISAAIEYISPILQIKFPNWNIRKKDFKILAELAKEYQSMEEFLETYTLNPLTPSEAQNNNSDKLVLITVHSAKGTECDVCYLFAANPGMYPHNKAENINAIEEERRVLYVAVTRARKELIITRTLKFPWSREFNSNVYFLENVPLKLVRN